MSDTKTSLCQLETQLTKTFDVKEWSPTQYEIYKLLNQYVNDFKETQRIYELRDDKIIIRNNLKDQTWFTASKSKPIISHLIDSMKLSSYVFEQNQDCLHFNVVLSFDHFNFIGCLYKNHVNDCINYYIYFENQKQKAYLTYFTHCLGMELKTDVKKMKLPEFDKIYQIINIGSTILYQCDLINFFSELIMYYDESGLSGQIPIGHELKVTLNQLADKFNTYLSQKHDETNYKFIGGNF